MGRPTASMNVSASDYAFTYMICVSMIFGAGSKQMLQRQQMDSQQPGRPQSAFFQRWPADDLTVWAGHPW